MTARSLLDTESAVGVVVMFDAGPVAGALEVGTLVSEAVAVGSGVSVGVTVGVSVGVGSGVSVGVGVSVGLGGTMSVVVHGSASTHWAGGTEPAPVTAVVSVAS